MGTGNSIVLYSQYNLICHYFAGNLVWLNSMGSRFDDGTDRGNQVNAGRRVFSSLGYLVLSRDWYLYILFQVC